MLAQEKLRDVCIQDPRNETAYLVPASALPEFRVDSLEDEVRTHSVTFVVSDESLFDTLPDPSVALASSQSDVIIRNNDTSTEFHFTFEQLRRFEIDRPNVHPDAKTYTLPMPEALVEEMPAAVRALLQSGSALNQSLS